MPLITVIQDNRRISLSQDQISSIQGILCHQATSPLTQQPSNKKKKCNNNRGRYFKFKKYEDAPTTIITDYSLISYPENGILYQLNVSQGQEDDLWDAVQFCYKNYSTDNKFKFKGQVWTKRSASCNGCKACTQEDCVFTKPVDRKRRTCDNHQNITLERHGASCPVKFYWLFNKSTTQYFMAVGDHNHRSPPHHKVHNSARNTLREHIISNPHIPPLQIQIGLNLHRTCPALINISRLTKLRAETLEKMYGGKLDSHTLGRVELNLFKKAEKDFENDEFSGVPIIQLLFPYLRVVHVDDSGVLVHSQNLFQSIIASKAEYLVVDLKHGNNEEGLHHFGIAIYNIDTKKSTMVSRTRMDKMDSTSYKMAFLYFFQTLERDCELSLSTYLQETLLGVLVDYSVLHKQLDLLIA